MEPSLGYKDTKVSLVQPVSFEHPFLKSAFQNISEWYENSRGLVNKSVQLPGGIAANPLVQSSAMLLGS